jgi:hypothetical protein
MIDKKLLYIILIIVVVAGIYLVYRDLVINPAPAPDSEVIETTAPATATESFGLGITSGSEEQNSLDRFFNPMRYPYKSPPSYYSGMFDIPFQVMGCGGRRGPCMNGISPISNPLPGINVIPGQIAPTNIYTRGPIGQPQQVGVIYKIDGDNNTIYPLFGRKRYPNGDKWEYYTMLNQVGLKIPVPPKRNYEELLTNDIIVLQGVPGKYRVTIYESDFPQYIPY